MIKTSILFLNDLGLDVRTACERNPTKDTPTANTNTSQAKMLSTPVNSFLRRRDMLVSEQKRAALKRVVTRTVTSTKCDLPGLSDCAACYSRD